MFKRKIGLIGTIDETHQYISGQYDRTEIIKDGLIRAGYAVSFVNMINWNKQPVSVFLSIIMNYFKNDAVVFLASLNGTRVLLSILSCLKSIKGKPVFQIAVGGHSNFDFLYNNKKYREKVAKLDKVFVEVEPMVDDYATIHLLNVEYLPNCKTLNIKSTNIRSIELVPPYRFCTYSRVTPDKGITEAIQVVESINLSKHIRYCTLDIYGTYLPQDEEWFKELMSAASDAITFKGRIERKDSTNVLSQYDMMLFPTRHNGEGVPGGMIDCYEAGLPIVTCRTSYMTSIVHDEVTGFIYDNEQGQSLEYVVLKYTDSLDIDAKRLLRVNCLKEAQQYDIESVISKLSVSIDSSLKQYIRTEDQY